MSSTILPPRAHADSLAALPAFPIDADVMSQMTESLRPTWIPVDPITFVPPKRKQSRAGLFALGAVGAVGVWALGFAAFLGAQSVHDQWTKHAAAQSLTTQANVAMNDAPATKTAPAIDDAKNEDVTLTVNVNDLPKSKDFKAKKKS